MLRRGTLVAAILIIGLVWSLISSQLLGSAWCDWRVQSISAEKDKSLKQVAGCLPCTAGPPQCYMEMNGKWVQVMGELERTLKEQAETLQQLKARAPYLHISVCAHACLQKAEPVAAR